NGANFKFRPTGEIQLDAPKAIGYAVNKQIVVASGANSVTWLIAGIWPKYRHSKGAPDLNSIFLRSGPTGDVNGKDFLYYVAPGDVVENDNTQAGGSITFHFVDWAGAARNMSATTVLNVGFNQNYFRFNA